MKSRLQHGQLKQFLQWCLTTYNGRIVAIGLIAGVVYLPTYVISLIRIFLGGNSTPILNLGFLYLGLERLWKHRQEILNIQVLRDDRFIGHLIILGSALWMPFLLISSPQPFFKNSIAPQAILWMLILIGIAWSSCTPKIFGSFPLATALVLVSMYPEYIGLSNALLRILTGPHLFENMMAWLGSIAVGLLGYAAEAEGRFISLPDGAVEVASGCTGFDMAVVLAGISLMWGLFIKADWRRVIAAVVTGIAIAFTFNIPRVVLLTFAAVYWGEESFDFWHGFWGGQIFATFMFTAYYYAAIAIYDQKSRPSKQVPSE
jgi:exosortase/archaeosortase family protein